MLVLDYQRMSTEDGPGLRTTLFVKGCPLKCRWCHNPESISAARQLEWIGARCMGCLECVKACKNGALKAEDKIKIDREACLTCGSCEEACPTKALEIKGRKESVDQVFAELIKDKAYFGAEGGVTLSGGEIMTQADEAAALLKKLKEAGVGTAVDTCGFAAREKFDLIFDYTDIFLYDIKLIDSRKHREFTGVPNEIILDNFNYLAEKVEAAGKKLWVRTPVIPGATDSDENIAGIADFIKGKFHRYELCAFNNLCRDKYERLYEDWYYHKTQLMTAERMEELVNIAKSRGLSEVYYTGATRINKEV